MKIPVFHDDQHGTAIVVGAAATNALHVSKKRFEDIQVVSTGGGASGHRLSEHAAETGCAAQECLALRSGGSGLSWPHRPDDRSEGRIRQGTTQASLAEVIVGADLFLGLSGPGVLTPEMVKTMAPAPIICLSQSDARNPARCRARGCPDAIIATGRSDFPNQVNNVLCFPFIFRGALDVRATTINSAMELACIGIAALARATSAEAAAAYKGEQLSFGADYLIPKPFDPRLIGVVASVVAKATMKPAWPSARSPILMPTAKS